MDPVLIEALIPIVAIVMGMLTVLIPITGLTLRFALKPIAESVAKMREAEGAGRELSLVVQRVALLEQQIAGMDTSIEQLLEADDFRTRLEAPTESPPDRA